MGHQAASGKVGPVVISLAYQMLLIAVIIGGALHYGVAGQEWGYLARMLDAWDAGHYLRIAEEGYTRNPAALPLIVFFPMYPLLISALAPVLGVRPAAFAVTTMASIAAHALLFFYLRWMGYGSRRVIRVVALVLVSPISIYFTALYSEALYFFVTVMFVMLLRREEYFLAALYGFVAALTRNMGLLFVIPYLCACWGSGSRGLVRRRAAYSALIAGGTAVYLAINTWVQGDPLAFTGHLSRNWYKSSVNPFRMYWGTLTQFASGRAEAAPGYELLYFDRLATLAFPLLCATYLFRVYGPQRPGEPPANAAPGMPAGFFSWAVAQYLIICSQSFWVSNLRYLSLVLPGYLMLEYVLVRRWSYATWLLMSAAVAAWAARQYLRLSWVF